ncbi:methyltransferase, TIGR04325 family [Variovorax sp. J22P271]|uniref:methyltransferase, TIGR04325 family n=1 Tax=Variovorax davisae TaxID=3053515 RepID=UPI002575F734|nr:methyltransferase, TIGR04325 family [Variovorax sp. J22P271]MDM0035358.1 methyltransferase, TIGR04325 family [Variovorax sp. J22P271]
MTMLNWTRRLRQLPNAPVLRSVLLRLKSEEFHTPAGFCKYFGVFECFDAARAWLPRNEGFDNAALVRGYQQHARHVFAYDYPMMWWLQLAFRDGARTLLDIGGSYGVHYYAYGRYLQMPDDLIWEVAELPAMIAIGREFAARKTTALRFTRDVREAGRRATIWLSSGALQYMDEGRLDRWLQMSGARPSHILLNKLPIYDGSDFVTAQNIGCDCYAPVHVYNRAKFVSEVEGLGYTLKDEWKVHERSLWIPGHPECAIQAFSGLYFSRTDSTHRPLSAASTSVAAPPPLALERRRTDRVPCLVRRLQVRVTLGKCPFPRGETYKVRG